MSRLRQTQSTLFRKRSEKTDRPMLAGLSILCWTLLWGIVILSVSHIYAAGPLLPKRQVPKRPVTKKNTFSLPQQFGASADSQNYAVTQDSLIQQASFTGETGVPQNPGRFTENESTTISNSNALDLDFQGIFNDLEAEDNTNENSENDEKWNGNRAGNENEEIESENEYHLSQSSVDPQSGPNAQVALAAGTLAPTTFAQAPKHPVRTSDTNEKDVGDSAQQRPGLSPDNPYAQMYPDSVQANAGQENPNQQQNFAQGNMLSPYGPLSLSMSAPGGSSVGSTYGFPLGGANPNGYMSPYNQAGYNQMGYNQMGYNSMGYQTAGYYYPYGPNYATPYSPYAMAGYMGAEQYGANSAYAPPSYQRRQPYYDEMDEGGIPIESDGRYYSVTQTMFETLCYFNPMNLPKGPDRGVGGPMLMRSWKDRPLYVGFFGGVMFGDELISRLVDQGDGGTGGLTFGWYCDDYWGLESRLHFSGLPGKDTAYGRQKFQEWYQEAYGTDYVPATSSRNNAITVFDVSVHYYPLGNAKWRPYLKLGVGLVNQTFRDVYGYKHDYNSIAVPVGIGVKYWWNERVAIHMELVDNIITSTEIVDTQNNLSLTFGLNFPIGRVKRREPVVYWPYTPSAK